MICCWLRQLPACLLAPALALGLSACGGAQQAPPPEAGQQLAQTAPAAPAQVETPPVQRTAPPVETAKAPASRPKPPAPAESEPPRRADAPPEPKAEAPPAPPPPIVKTVPAGAVLSIAFDESFSSKTNMAGDPFRAKVTQDLLLDGMIVVPAGSIVTGSVTEAVGLKTIGGTAKLALQFSTLELPTGDSTPIRASFHGQGKSETKKDTATIAGAAAGGALLGRLLSKHNKTTGTVIGAVVGAGAGTAVAASTKGQEVEIPAATEIQIRLNDPSQVTVRRP